MVNQYAKLGASGVLFASLLYLVVTGKMAPGDYQTLTVAALAALGGHASAASRITTPPANPTPPTTQEHT
jgi:uncharacterized membrane protein